MDDQCNNQDPFYQVEYFTTISHMPKMWIYNQIIILQILDPRQMIQQTTPVKNSPDNPQQVQVSHILFTLLLMFTVEFM